MAKLSLLGKLNFAVEQYGKFFCSWWMIPYYGAMLTFTKEEFAHQIDLQSFASQYATLWERVLSILLKKLEEAGSEQDLEVDEKNELEWTKRSSVTKRNAEYNNDLYIKPIRSADE